VSDLLRGAFVALGREPTRDELGFVAEVLHRTEISEQVALLDSASTGDRDANQELATLATEAGSNGFVALDLAVAYGAGVEALTRGPRRRDA
jgi:hypothetical protein